MSFIYAHKFENKIKILSDTKPTIEDKEISRLEKRFTNKECKLFLKYGFVKTVIYKPNITISSAGDVEHFNELLEILYNNDIDDIKIILNKALNINFRYNGDTDFIITTEKDIYEIKGKGIRKVIYSWIGDESAYIKFKEYQDNNVPKEIYYTEEVSENIRKNDMEMCFIEDAFKSLIDNEKVKTVGGFVVRCIYDKEKYEFLAPYVSTSCAQQIVKSGEKVKFDTSIDKGGFTFIPLENCEYYSAYLRQIDKYIVYRPGYTDDNYSYISMPHIYSSKEYYNLNK